MKWTTKRPDREGWWWAKDCVLTGYTDAVIYRVRHHHNEDGSNYFWIDRGETVLYPEDFVLWSDEPVQEPEEN